MRLCPPCARSRLLAASQPAFFCRHLHAAAGWCLFARLCPAEVAAIEDCIGISKSIGGCPAIPKRCADRAALLEACLDAQQAVAEERTTRCQGPQPLR